MNAQNKLLHICIYVYIYTYINILHPQNAISEPFWGGFPKTLATIVAIRRSGMLLDFDQTTTAFQNGLQQQSKKHSLRRSTLHVSEANGELVGGWTTHLKNISQNGNLPQIGVKIKNIWNHHLVNHTKFSLSCLGTKIIPPNLSNLNPSRQGQDEVRWMVFHFIWFTQLHIIYLQKHWKDSEFSYIIPDMVSLNHSGAFFFSEKILNLNVSGHSLTKPTIWGWPWLSFPGSKSTPRVIHGFMRYDFPSRRIQKPPFLTSDLWWRKRGTLVANWWFPKMVVLNNHGCSYEKWSFWRCFGGTIILGNPQLVVSSWKMFV